MKQAVAAVIRNGSRVLLHRRSMESRGQAGKWENAGGQIDEGETPELAIVREIKEELGVDFLIEKRVLEDVFDSGDDEWYVVIFEGSITGTPKVIIPEETMEIKWFEISELGSLDLASYTREDFVRFGWIA